tara:strand:- start:425 stop:559 length:135 start_codon:yes stop_codon:yes gene_type:complete
MELNNKEEKENKLLIPHVQISNNYIFYIEQKMNTKIIDLIKLKK